MYQEHFALSFQQPKKGRGRRGIDGQSFYFFFLSQQEETDETPGWDLSSHGGVRVMELCRLPTAEALCWDLTSLHCRHSRSLPL